LSQSSGPIKSPRPAASVASPASFMMNPADLTICWSVFERDTPLTLELLGLAEFEVATLPF
jgi:hypothetical protein